MKNNSRGISHHLLLPVLAVIAVAGIGAFVMIRSSSAATYTTYSTNCAIQKVIAYKSTSPYNRGVCIKAVQQRLITLRYLAAGSADSIYGPKTYAAVKRFQANNNLAQTGLGPKTWAKLFSNSAIGVTIVPSTNSNAKAVCEANASKGYKWENGTCHL